MVLAYFDGSFSLVIAVLLTPLLGVIGVSCECVDESLGISALEDSCVFDVIAATMEVLLDGFLEVLDSCGSGGSVG